uniref:Uncharacterized protein n=1 Tax=Panagrolaimus sp. PS1159 TaxID=55785 RepID=A0AC35G4I0_9BILA
MEGIDGIIEFINVKQNLTNIVETLNGRTRNGQNFTIYLRDTGVQYTVHAIIDEPHFKQWQQNNLKHLLENHFSTSDWIITVKFFWKTAALKAINEWKVLLENGNYDEFRKNAKISDTQPSSITLPRECFLNPDKYIKIGDSIFSEIIPSPTHEGIYVGNGEVVHISTKLDLRGQPYIKRTKLFPHTDPNEKRLICLKIFRIRQYSHLETTLIASKYAPIKMNKFCVVEHETKCLKFTSLCKIGYEQQKAGTLCIKDSDKNMIMAKSEPINVVTPLATSFAKIGTAAVHHTSKAKTYAVIVKDSVPLDGLVNSFD